MPPMSRHAPIRPFRTSISTANIVSLARVGLSDPTIMTEAIIATSMQMTDRVRINVP